MIRKTKQDSYKAYLDNIRLARLFGTHIDNMIEKKNQSILISVKKQLVSIVVKYQPILILVKNRSIFIFVNNIKK